MTYEQYMTIKTLLLERISERQSVIEAEKRYGRSTEVWKKFQDDEIKSLLALTELYNAQGAKK